MGCRVHVVLWAGMNFLHKIGNERGGRRSTARFSPTLAFLLLYSTCSFVCFLFRSQDPPSTSINLLSFNLQRAGEWYIYVPNHLHTGLQDTDMHDIYTYNTPLARMISLTIKCFRRDSRWHGTIMTRSPIRHSSSSSCAMNLRV